MSVTPVILVCYNRPQHTSLMLKALQEHDVQNLIIFSDAAKTEKEIKKVEETRALLDKISWTKAEIVLQKENQGLAKSIVSAADYTLSKHEQMILLEDDCIPQRHFFTFMEKCLTQYRDNEKVFGINGYTVPIAPSLLEQHGYDAYFYPRIGSWGWGTWKRAWRHYDTDLLKLCLEASDKKIDLTQGGADIPAALLNQLTGTARDVWTLNWVVTVYLQGGYYVYPTVSHIDNIGCDGSGVNCGSSNYFSTTIAERPPLRIPGEVVLNRDLINNYNRYFGGPFQDAEPPVKEASESECPAPEAPVKKDLPGLRFPKGKSLNIVHINTGDFGGGAANMAFGLAEAQRRDGHNACIIAGRKHTQVDFSERIDPIFDLAVHHECTDRGLLFYDLQGSHFLAAHPKIQQADILHLHNLHGNYFNPYSLLILSRMKPVVWTLHDMHALTGHCSHSFECGRWIEGCHDCPNLETYPELPVDSSAELWRDKRQIYAHSKLSIVTPSRWLEAKVREGILSGQPATTVHNGVKTEVFKPKPLQEMRRKLGLPESAFIIGSVADKGVLANAFKGGASTLQLLERFFTLFPNAYFLNIGGSHDSGDQRIINTGYIADEHLLADYYCCLDVFLYLTRADNCPLVVLEALSCGVPTVASAIGGIPELIDHGVNGFLVDQGDVDRALTYLHMLLNDKELNARIRTGATGKAVDNFDHSLIVEKYYDIYAGTCAAWERTGDIRLDLDEVPAVIKTEMFLESLSFAQELRRAHRV